MSRDDESYKKEIMILSCSGCSNGGQISNQAARELTEEGFGRMSSLAGISAGLTGFVQSAEKAEQMIVIDGCETACGRVILEKAGIPLKKHIIVTRLDIGKNVDLTLHPDDVAAVKHAVRLAFNRPVAVVFKSPEPLSPGDRARSKMFSSRCC